MYAIVHDDMKILCHAELPSSKIYGAIHSCIQSYLQIRYKLIVIDSTPQYVMGAHGYLAHEITRLPRISRI